MLSNYILIGGSIATTIGWGLAKIYEGLSEEDQTIIDNHPIVENIKSSIKDSAVTFAESVTKGTSEYIEKIK